MREISICICPQRFNFLKGVGAKGGFAKYRLEFQANLAGVGFLRLKCFLVLTLSSLGSRRTGNSYFFFRNVISLIGNSIPSFRSLKSTLEVELAKNSL
jgi:hypothetical protein